MKTRKKLNLVLMVLICVLIILVGFVGIYKKDVNRYSNIIPNYKLASDLKGATILELKVNDSKNTNYYDKDGKKVEESEVTEENEKDYTKEEVDINNKENLTEENYRKTVEIFKERLKFLQVDQYSMDLDSKSGKIILTFEDDYPEDVESILPMEGKLELKDSNTSDVILDYANVKSAEVNYVQTEEGYTAYIDLKLTDEGLNKINDIDKYKTSETKKDGSKETTTTTNKFKFEFDTEEIEEISYDDISVNKNTLRIIVLKNSNDTSTVNSKINMLTVVSKLVNIGKTPVIYTIDAQEYAKTTVDTQSVYRLIICSVIIMSLIGIYLIVKYKFNGVLTAIGMAAIVSLVTILARITNITISLNSFAAVVGLIVLNTYLVSNILKEIKNKEKTFSQNIKTAYLKSIDLIIISLVIFAVFAFNSMTVISSMGLLLFWGWLAVVLGNLLLTIPMLKIGGKE